MQLGIPLTAILDQLKIDAPFRERFETVQNLLSHNVAAALYRSAMEGSVSAQTFFLKSRPPQEWLSPEGEGSIASTTPPTDDGLEELTVEELLELMREEEIPPPSSARQ